MKVRPLSAFSLARRRGAVILLVALSLILLLGVLALVIDGGLLMIERRAAQAAADASALAASHAMHQGNLDNVTALEAATQAARAFAAANGFSHGSNVTVTTHIPPISGTFEGQEDYVMVVINRQMPRRFSGIWGNDVLTVGARAVARGVPQGSASLILLDPNRSGSLAIHGSARLVTDSGIQVNSVHPTAMIATNTGHTRPMTPGKSDTPVIKVGGGYSTSSSGYFLGKIITGSPPVADPLANLPIPPQSGQVFANQQAVFPEPWGNRTMNPGVYNAGVNIGGGMTVTMNPGIYYMKNTFTIANGARVTGHGVMIYVDSSGGNISFQGGGNITLTPPTSGPFEGITLYLDRNSTRDINIANGSTTVIEGTIYAANARIIFAGGAQYNQYGVKFICKSMDISNNAYIGIGDGGDGPATVTFDLVE